MQFIYSGAYMVEKGIEHKTSLAFSVCCCENEKVWFVTNYSCMLYEYDTRLRVLRLLRCLSEDKQIQHLMGAMVKYKDKIIMAPHQGSQFVIYDMKTGNIKRYMCEIDCSLKFVSAITYGEKVYFVGGEPVIVEFCIETEQWSYHRLSANDSRVVCNSIWGRGTAQVIDGYIYIPQIASNYIIRLNLKTYETTFVYAENETVGYNDTYVQGDYLYAFPRYGGNIVKIGLKNNFAVEILKSDLRINQSMSYIGTSKGIFFYDGETGNIGCLNYRNKIEKVFVSLGTEKNYNIYRSLLVNDRVLISRVDGKVLEYLLNGNKMQEISDELPVDEFEKYCNYIMKQNILREETLSLNSYLDKIVMDSVLRNNRQKNMHGEKIYALTSN